jgi:putative FmdB family regulatory protein
MPTYEYHCDGCEHHFDEFQSIMEKPLKKCPQCGKSKLRRIFGTGAAILFKGSGFYQTDYRSESYKAAAKAEQESTKPPAKAEPASSTPATEKTAAADTSSNGSAVSKTKGTKKSSKSSARVSDD